MEKSASVAVLITVHNRKEDTLTCLSGLYSQERKSGYSLSVYMTDDGCTDGTAEAVRARFPEVNIVPGDGNLFWNRGMYAAWEAAARARDYDFYLWLNDDTFVRSNLLQVLIRAAEETGGQAIIVGATENTGHTALTYGGRVHAFGIPKPDGRLVPVDYFNGNIVLVPRAVYCVLGNLDRYFTHSMGDFDYGMRAGEAGIGMYQAGEVLGECDAHPTLDRWCNPDVPLRLRWKMLYRPNGMPPREMFHFDRRHNGLALACFHYVTVHVRCLLPKLWDFKDFRI